MPIGPRHRLDKSPATRRFTDREPFKAAFDRALAASRPYDATGYRVLVYYGVGGIGKTALRRHLGERLDEQDADVRWAVVDFEAASNRAPENALFVMRNELKRKYGFRFPLFDLAYAEFWMRRNPQVPMAQSAMAGLEEGDVLMDLLLAVEDVPGLGLLTKIPKAVSSLGGHLRTWWLKQGQAALRELPGLEPDEILDRLPLFWAEDLGNALAVTGEPVVLFLDTYEALWEGRRMEHLRFSVDAWIREWVLQLPGVLWVVGGREKVAWAELDPDWADALEQHLVGALSDDDARHFLTHAGVTDKAVQEVLIAGAEGVPFYLDLGVETYERLVAGGRTPGPDDFARAPREVLDRFIKYLSLSERETLKVLSAARIWDRSLFEKLVATFQTGYPATAFAELCGFSFIEAVPTEADLEQSWWTMHALMRQGLLEHGDFDLITRAHGFLLSHYEMILDAADSRAVTEQDRQALVEAFYHAEQVMAPEELFSWYADPYEVFYQAAQWRALIPLQEKLLVLAEAHYGADQVEIADLLNGMAGLYQAQGRYAEAEPLYVRGLSIYEQHLDPDDLETTSLLNNLGLLYSTQGRYAEAEQLYLRNLSICEKHLAPDDLEVAMLLNNLAYLYREQGRYAETEALMLRSLSICEKHLGPDDLDVAMSLNNLAEVYRIQGRYAEVEPLFMRALSIVEQHLGPDHPDTAKLLSNLGLLYSTQGRYAEAEPLILQSLAITEKQLGSDHPTVATMLNNLADLYRAQGRSGEVEALMMRSLSIIEQHLGQDHPIVATMLNNLGEFYRTQGRYAEAEPLYEASLWIIESQLGPDHANMATILNNLAEVYRADGRYTEAEPLFVRSLSIIEQQLGPDHANVAMSLNNLGELYRAQGRYAEAEPLYVRSVSVIEQQLGPDHPNLSMPLNNLALLHSKQGRYAEAERLYVRALSICAQKLGPDHPQTTLVRTNYDVFLKEQAR